MDGDETLYSALLEKIKESNVVIDPAAELAGLVKTSSLDALLMPRYHYSAKGNRIVADVAARFLIEREMYGASPSPD